MAGGCCQGLSTDKAQTQGRAVRLESTWHLPDHVKSVKEEEPGFERKEEKLGRA